jgi:hypothetical protein
MSTHMDWCKRRALDLLDHGDVVNALASFASDVRKDESTSDDTVRMLIATIGMQCAMSGDVAGMRRFIEGFNG